MRQRMPGGFRARSSGRSREAVGNDRPRGMAIQGPQGPGQNPAYRSSGAFSAGFAQNLARTSQALEPPRFKALIQFHFKDAL